uniref:Peptidyl-prolyl cis-trans isomerase n=1 Tax=Strombidium rassoulzadegani TaxID=1082188 RepID=A0A7S3FWT3_9SPIT|mmetsp:Transcript_4748/g.8124  ORF Transcript_4748/g.8124 Transcript_4748/m.8124 type:complete len:181 (+) Transcript_4748:387-929(+)
MSINHGANIPSKVVIELFDEYCPKTCDNFRKLCQGFQREDKVNISYAGSDVSRVVPGMFVQAGDLSKVLHAGKIAPPAAGFSIYGGEFPDESFHVNHNEQGLLGMCKRSNVKHSNECQFYVTLGAPLSFLDGKNVIFGRVVEGFRVFKLIEKMHTVNEKPTPNVIIEKAGVYEAAKITKK